MAFLLMRKSAVIFTILFQKKNSLKTDRTLFIEIIKNPSLNSGLFYRLAITLHHLPY
mgnify:CR=1 FL=1